MKWKKNRKFCDKCFLLFNSKETLTNHQSSCIQSVSSNKNDQNIPELLHNAHTTHSCDLCGRVFTSKGLLISHRMKCYQMAPPNSTLTSFTPEMLPKKGDAKTDGQVEDRKPLVCDVCFLAFTEEDALRNHKEKHAGSKQPKCDACDKTFSSQHTSSSHLLICKKKPFACEVCRMTSCEECDIMKHKSSEHRNIDKETIGSVHGNGNSDEETVEETSDEKPNICNKCFATFSTKESREAHTSVCAAGEKRHHCDGDYCCHLESETVETFTAHVHTQDGDDKMWTCAVCRLMVPCVDDLHRHMETHHTSHETSVKFDKTSVKFDETSVKFKTEPHEPEETIEPPTGEATSVKFNTEPYDPEERIESSNFLVHVPNGDQQPYRCEFCDKSFEQETSLKYHRAVHNTDKPFKCNLCDKTFSSKGNMIQHQQLHSGQKPHKCDQCDKSFNRKSHLKEHKRTHSGEKPYRCAQCEKSFSDRSNLTRHMLIHVEGKPHKCDHCERTFYRKAHMVQHMRMHSGARPFQCDQCEKSFARKTNLTEHLLWHRNEFPYQCNVCDKSFGNRSTLTNHMQVHMVDKPHQCNLCGKSFVTIYRLNRHVLSHSDAKPHKCHICDKRFNLKTHLTKHVLIHNRCAVCRQSFRSAEELAAHMSHHNTGSSTGEMCACAEPRDVVGESLVGIVKEEPMDEPDSSV